MFKLRVLSASALAITLFYGGGCWSWDGVDGEADLAIRLKPDYNNGRNLFHVCAECHMDEGWGRRDGSIPQISGQHRNVLIKQLADIRARDRENPSMFHFISPESLGDAQSLADVAAYVETLPMKPNPGLGPGTDLVRGEALYGENCAKCHGEHGEGDNEKFLPRIQGQHYKYMLRQFRWIRNGQRLNADPEMTEQIKAFSDRDMEAVIDYISRLKPPATDLAPAKSWRNPDFG